MMAGPLVLAAFWTTLSRTSSTAAAASFVGRTSSSSLRSKQAYSVFVARSVFSTRALGSSTNNNQRQQNQQLRLFASSASEPSSSASTVVPVANNVSRLATLQTLLSKHGAPGSIGCRKGNNDLIPVAASWTIQDATPELIADLVGGERMASVSDEDIDQYCNLHPYLVPIARSQSTGHVICAYRNPMTEESDKNHPWPIVESKAGAPGFQLIALNSEHLMRRIVCECDAENSNKNNDASEGEDDDNSIFLIQLYNEGLGQGLLNDSKLDTPYQVGSVQQLGYGVDKYVLLRVGPFPDLYQQMSRNHFSRGDEQSALIAAEASNTKLSGFGSTFRFYARLLSSCKNREEETRDAARMCLRLPLHTIGMEYSDLEEVGILGQIIPNESVGPPEDSIKMIKKFYDLMKSVEKDNDDSPATSGKTQNQMIIEEATDILDQAILDKKPWKEVRVELAKHFRSGGKDELANFCSFLY